MQGAVTIALFGWIPVAVGLFAILPPRRAALAAFLFGWLFLPMAGHHFDGMPNLTKFSATSYGVLLGILLFDTSRLVTFKPRLIDLPMLIWCLVPFASSVSNGLGVYDGISSVVNQVTVWGAPYFVGRLYFGDLFGLRDLAIGIVIGGLIYIPLCLLEMRVSPQLHNWIYGFHQHSFHQQVRYGGYRPMVFMQHGLMVALWMASAALMAFWLWRAKSYRGLLMTSAPVFVPILAVVAVLCKSLGALILLVMGLGALMFGRATGSKIAMIGLLMIAPAYIVLRIADSHHINMMVGIVESIEPHRAQSFEGRLRYEDMLVERAMEQPLLGWGGWGRNRVFDEGGEDITVSDGMWIITFGQHGVVGLASVILVLLLPGVLLVKRCPTELWLHPLIAPAVALSVLCTLYLIDNMPNAMINPIFMLAVGGITGMGFSKRHLIAATRSGNVNGRADPAAVRSFPTDSPAELNPYERPKERGL